MRELLNKNERIPQELLNLGEIYCLYSTDPFPDELFRSHQDILDRLYKQIIDFEQLQLILENNLIREKDLKKIMCRVISLNIF